MGQNRIDHHAPHISFAGRRGALPHGQPSPTTRLLPARGSQPSGIGGALSRAMTTIRQNYTDGPGPTPQRTPGRRSLLGADDASPGGAFWRAVWGLVLAPLAPLGLTLLFATLVYLASEPDVASAWAATSATAADLFSTLYAPLMLGAAIGLAALSAATLRGRRAFAVAGALLGANGAAIVYAIDGALPIVGAVYAVFAGVATMLALRRVINVR